jgi:hypothetical protein
MIKIQGLGRRRHGLSHAECIEHHRNIHSKLGLGQSDHMGKYVLYYFREAFNAKGAPLAEFPWDMSAVEWFREKQYWDNFQEWLEAAPDGQEVKHDEASFLEREKCFMLPYDESIVVDRDDGGETIVLMRLLKFADGVSLVRGGPDHAASIGAIRIHFGEALRKLVINYITEATCLASGAIPYKPIDVVEIYKIDRAVCPDPHDVVRAFAVPAIAATEDALFAMDRSFNLLAEEVVFQG